MVLKRRLKFFSILGFSLGFLISCSSPTLQPNPLLGDDFEKAAQTQPQASVEIRIQTSGKSHRLLFAANRDLVLAQRDLEGNVLETKTLNRREFENLFRDTLRFVRSKKRNSEMKSAVCRKPFVVTLVNGADRVEDAGCQKDWESHFLEILEKAEELLSPTSKNEKALIGN